MSFFKKLEKHLLDFVKLAPAIVTVASIVTAITPTQRDNEIVFAIQKALNVVALNVGHNVREMHEVEDDGL